MTARLADAIEAGAELDAEQRALVAQAVRTFEALTDEQRAAALQRDSRQRRDELLRELARVHFGHLHSVRARVEAIRRHAARYRAGRWRHDGHAVVCPREPGSVEAALWHVLREGDVPGERRLHDILRGA